MKNKVASIAVLIAFVGLNSGCASIIKGSGPQSISIRSTPPDAVVKILDARTGNTLSQGRTPLIVPLKKSNGFFSAGKYRVVIEKEGFVTREVQLDARVSGWYLAGNFVFGGLIGWLIVDPATGAMWTLNPDELSVELNSAAVAEGAPIALMTIEDFAERYPALVDDLRVVAELP